MGEWVSVQSARELSQRQLAIEADEIEAVPQEEQQELALIYEAKGLSPDEAGKVAAELMADKGKALETLAQEELGLDPEQLGGSPWVAAATSFFLFAIGAICQSLRLRSRAGYLLSWPASVSALRRCS